MRNPPALLCLTLLGALATGLATPCVGEEVTLVKAAQAGEWSTVSQLIGRASDNGSIDGAGPDGTAAIHWAVHARNAEMVDALIRAGANLNAANRYGQTPLSLAAIDGNGPLLEKLLQAGADPSAAEHALPEGQTLAMLAARTGSVEALTALASHHAIDVNAREQRDETTALMWAALAGRADAARYLLKLGADPELKSKLTDYPHLGNGVLLTAPGGRRFVRGPNAAAARRLDGVDVCRAQRRGRDRGRAGRGRRRFERARSARRIRVDACHHQWALGSG